VRVEELDARTAPDAVLLTIHGIEQACLPELHPGEPVRSADEAIAFLRHQPVTHETFDWLGDGGCASLYIHGPKAAFVHLLVRPERRRSGLGAALLAAVRTRAVERGVEELHGHHATPAGAAFAAHFGAAPGQREVRSLLRLRTAELPELSVPSGWALWTWLTRVPDEHLAAFVRARAAMDDAPGSEEIGYPTASAARVRASEDSLIERRREMRLTIAINESGEIGAFTELRLSSGSNVALTDDTGTVAAHRGEGLARAVKLESLRRLRADHPQVEVVTTMNAEENAAMRHINESVGFRAAATLTTATLTL
jgi:GNAT superfamily N-acetyltransferase/RimJ/RimL family protein N-acetyltransferase